MRRALSFALVLLLANGCSVFNQQVTPPEAIEEKQAGAQTADQYQSGFASGYEAARADLAEKLAEDAEAMKALKIYKSMIYEGAMAAPEVVVVHRPEQLSADGQRYVPARQEAMIRRPARFVSREALNGLLGKQGKASLYGVFPDRPTADAAVAQLSAQKAAGDQISALPTPDGRYAVYAVSFSGKDYWTEAN